MRVIPSLELLSKISQHIQKQGGKNYCLFLLGKEAGLRVSEAVKFNLEVKAPESSFYLVQSKGKTRSVYIPPSVISELKSQNWQPNSITRHGFHKFLEKTKKKLNIGPQIELTPHTLRRFFTTYYAENGVPLPVLQKALGYSSVRTTALYWKSDKVISNKLISKWLDKSPFINHEITLIPTKKVVKDKEYWKIYNAKRKEYLASKKKESRVRLKNVNSSVVDQVVDKNRELELENQLKEQSEPKKLTAQIEHWEPLKNYA